MWRSSFADVYIKLGADAITADRSIAEQPTDAEWFDADVLIASGARTGSPTEPREIDNAQRRQPPRIVGSDLSAEQVQSLFGSADGAIVGPVAQEGRPVVEPGRSATGRSLHDGGPQNKRWPMTQLTELCCAQFTLRM
jgi:predicted TIM-barrel enzyme